MTESDMIDENERANRAVKAFRKMQSGLTAYARAITKNPKIRVIMSDQSAYTDGEHIYYRPPIALGDNLQHVRGSCDKRDPVTRIQLCPACAVGEKIRVSIYHEIGHHVGESFAELSENHKREALMIAVRELGHEPQVFRDESFVALANSINPYLALLFNGVEDARVDLNMVTRRKGIRVMMEASVVQIFRDGVEIPGRDNLPWSEQPLNAQAAVACMLRIVRYTGWEDHLHPDVVRHTAMPEIEAILDKLRTSTSAADTFMLTYPLMEGLRKYGYFKKPEEIPLDVPPPDSGEDSGDADSEQSDDDGESSDSASKSDGSHDDGQQDEDDSSSDASDDGGSDVETSGAEDQSTKDSSDVGSGEVSDDQDADGSGSDLQEDEEQESDRDGSESGTSDSDPGSDGANEAGGGDASPDRGDASEGGEGGASESDGGPVPGRTEAEGSSTPDAGGDQDSADDDGDSPGAGGHHSEGESSDAPADGDEQPREEVGDSGSGSGGTPAPGEDSDQGGTDPGQGDDGDASGEEDRDSDGHHGDDQREEGEVDADLQGRSAGGDPQSGGNPEQDGDPEQDGNPEQDGDEGDGSGSGEDSSDGGAEGDSGVQPVAGGEGSEEGENEGPSGDGGRPDPSDQVPADADGTEDGSGGDGSGPDQQDIRGSDAEGDGERGEPGVPADVPEVPGEACHDGDGSAEPDRDESGSGPDELSREGEPEQSDRGAAPTPPPDHKHGTDGLPCGCNECETYGTPGDVEGALEEAHTQVAALDDEESGEADQILTVMIMQGKHFDTSSKNILGVREIAEGGDYFADYPNEDVIPEEYIAPALMHMRRAFSDNKKGAVERNLKSGRVNTTSLGRRAWSGDPRLFDKRKVPGKKDYSVLIGIDLSSSTTGGRADRIRKAALAQAELCARAGIRFAIYGHSGNNAWIQPGNPSAGSGMMMDIVVVKTFTQPWDDAAKKRMMSVGPSGGNVDGHTFEYYRKRLDEEQTTDRILMYYTDGAMPAMNKVEETEILLRELKIFERRGYVAMGVGIGTDSPVQYGLDTYRLDSMSDMKGVVTHLEKAIRKRG